jgi:NitT/TauT family transport system permease protein
MAAPKTLLTLGSFAVPLALWCLVSYVPWIWHPLVRVTDASGSTVLQVGQRVERAAFDDENRSLTRAGLSPARGVPENPVFLPAPHEVAQAFVTSFTTPPQRPGDPWLHESLLHSLWIIFWGFFLSSLVGVPLGVLCGTYRVFRGLFEPFIEFFRYLPAPAFAALAVAIWGIGDGPKVAIIVIGTFFQQVLVISATTSRLDPTLLEAARTLGGRRLTLVTHVVIPGVLPHLYRDQRILLGWAWTYLIVSEVVGTSTGITYFINQQAKYRIYQTVFAAIFMIGVLGVTSDVILAWLGKALFPWFRLQKKEA